MKQEQFDPPILDMAAHQAYLDAHPKVTVCDAWGSPSDAEPPEDQ